MAAMVKKQWLLLSTHQVRAFSQDIQNGCTPVTVSFTKDMTGIASWKWNFDDGTPVNTTDANPVHIFTNATPSTILYRRVKLVVQSPGGCKDSTTSIVTVYPAIDATFTASTNIVCSGNPITFTHYPEQVNISGNMVMERAAMGQTLFRICIPISLRHRLLTRLNLQRPRSITAPMK